MKKTPKINEVRRVRQRLGVTQGELAQMLGVHPVTVSKWERGALPFRLRTTRSRSARSGLAQRT
jgi:DNA-binding XRE family transcriptional regulator